MAKHPVVRFLGESVAAEPETTTAQKVEKLQKDMDALRKDVNKLKDDMLANSAQGAKAAEDLQDIKKLLLEIAGKQEQITRQSGYGPGPQAVGPGAPPNGTATITLRNDYTSSATVHINGRPYPVGAGRTETLRGVPLGTFNYEVDVEGYGLVQPSRAETLRPNGQIITIYPRLGG